MFPFLTNFSVECAVFKEAILWLSFSPRRSLSVACEACTEEQIYHWCFAIQGMLSIACSQRGWLQYSRESVSSCRRGYGNLLQSNVDQQHTVCQWPNAQHLLDQLKSLRKTSVSCRHDKHSWSHNSHCYGYISGRRTAKDFDLIESRPMMAFTLPLSRLNPASSRHICRAFDRPRFRGLGFRSFGVKTWSRDTVRHLRISATTYLVSLALDD
jgi:hypothetical protein